MNDGVKGTLKEVAVTYFKALIQNVLERPEKITKHSIRIADLDPNLEPGISRMRVR
jgi:hypothetical protein